LALVIADNPASTLIGGFKESASAYRPCRHCLGTSAEIKTPDQLQTIQDDPSQSREFGINQRSILMDIPSFDICSGTLVCDIMHDLFEGLLPYETKLMLRCSLKKNISH